MMTINLNRAAEKKLLRRREVVRISDAKAARARGVKPKRTFASEGERVEARRVQDLEHYYRYAERYRKQHRDRYQANLEENRVKAKEYAREWRAASFSHREWHLKRHYGITVADYDAMLVAQEHKCALCRQEFPVGGRRPHVDHCHATQRIRGLLCTTCNVGLGSFKDSPALLDAAKAYLGRTTS